MSWKARTSPSMRLKPPNRDSLSESGCARRTSARNCTSPNAADSAALANYRAWVRWGFLAVLGFAVALFGIFHFVRRSAPKVTISYAGGPKIETPA